jgi:molybdenum cofactor biosynthesis enzyme
MVSISSKEVTPRTATAVCKVEFSNPLAATLIRENRSNKGDVFAVARVAGIMAAKRTVDLIPLCHPVPISRVAIFLQLRRWTPKVAPVGKNSPVGESGQAEALQKSQSWPGTGQGDSYQLQLNTMSTPEGDQDTSQQGTTQYTEPRQEGSQVQQRANGTERSWVDITATVECEGKTGVEMEAMTAASVAALTVYDMCKAVDKRMRIGDLRVTYKAGGKSGTWVDGISVGRTTKSGFNAGANTYSP